MNRIVGSFLVLSAIAEAAIVCASIARADEPPTRSAGGPTLVNPQWQPQTDSQGVAWMINPQSMLTINGGQSMIMQMGILTVNGAQFMPQRTQMTPDGSEYVFETFNAAAAMAAPAYSPYAPPMAAPFGAAPAIGPAGAPLLTTRRIKLDLAPFPGGQGTVRFVESFQNTSATAIQANISTSSAMRTMIRSALSGPSGANLDTATGQAGAAAAAPVVGFNGRIRRPMNMGIVRLAVPERDSLVALSEGNGNFPDALFYLPGSGKVKPEIEIQAMRSVRVSYNVSVPAHSTVSVVWGFSQHNRGGAFTAQELKDRAKAFDDRKWLAGLPESVVKSIVNLRRDEPAGSTAALLMQPVLRLAWQNHVERGKSDVLVQDVQSRMQGVVSGGNLGSISVLTSWGKTALALADVALICGGEASEQSMRVFLRNGEVLFGRVECKDLALKAEDGVEVKLPPEKINMLFLHASAGDGKAPADAVALLQVHDGQRLLVGGEARLHAISPWGGLDVGLGEIASLGSRREPQPLYRLALRDGSNLSVLLQDEPIELNSLRFGPLKFPAMEVRQLSSLKAPPRQPGAGPATGASGPLCQLIGDNVLAATIDAPQLKLATPGGTIGVPVKEIHTAERSGDPKSGGPFDIELANGRKVTGTLADRTVSIRFRGKVWEVPGAYLIGITGPRKAAPAADAAARHPTGQKRTTGAKPTAKSRPMPGKPAPPAAGGPDPIGDDPVMGPDAPPTTAPPPTSGDDPFAP